MQSCYGSGQIFCFVLCCPNRVVSWWRGLTMGSVPSQIGPLYRNRVGRESKEVKRSWWKRRGRGRDGPRQDFSQKIFEFVVLKSLGESINLSRSRCLFSVRCSTWLVVKKTPYYHLCGIIVLRALIRSGVYGGKGNLPKQAGQRRSA